MKIIYLNRNANNLMSLESGDIFKYGGDYCPNCGSYNGGGEDAT